MRKYHLIDKFSLVEKVLLRTALYGFIIIGGLAIFLYSFVWGLIYIGLATAGFIFGVLYFFCSHCPYPYQYSDCLFLPHGWIKKRFAFRPGPMSLSDKAGVFMITAIAVVFPQYWLLKNHVLLVIFWMLLAVLLVVFPFYYCRRCRHFQCPFNCVKKEFRGDQVKG